MGITIAFTLTDLCYQKSKMALKRSLFDCWRCNQNYLIRMRQMNLQSLLVAVASWKLQVAVCNSKIRNSRDAGNAACGNAISVGCAPV